MILDASVAAKWFLTDESLVAEADLVRVAMLDRLVSLAGPAILWPEVAHALVRAVRRRRIDDEIAQVMSNDFHQIRPMIAETEVDLRESVRVALTTGLSAYDAQYLLLGIHLGERMLTEKRRMFHQGRAHGYDVVWLGDVALPDGVLADTPWGYQ